MKKIAVAFILYAISMATFAYALSTSGTFTQPSGAYSAPTNHYTLVNGTKAKRYVVFSNPSSVSGPNTQGEVFVNCTGVPGTGRVDFEVHLQKDDNTWTTLTDTLDASVASRSTYAGGAVASVTAPVTVGTNSDKTGYTLTTTPLAATTFNNWTGAHTTQLAHLDADVSTAGGGSSGSGDTPINHNFGGANALLATYAGVATGGISIKAFLTSDYAATHTTDAYVKAKTYSLDDGTWAQDLNLSHGLAYTLVFAYRGAAATIAVAP
jgi:hypothetical protein